jgi:hypothetical protein
MKNNIQNPSFLHDSPCTSHSGLNWLFFLLIASFLVSCEFESDKEFFRELA